MTNTAWMQEVCPLECGGWEGTARPVGFDLSPLDKRVDHDELEEHWATEHPDVPLSEHYETYEGWDEDDAVDPRRVAAVVLVAAAAGAAFGAAFGLARRALR